MSYFVYEWQVLPCHVKLCHIKPVSSVFHSPFWLILSLSPCVSVYTKCVPLVVFQTLFLCIWIVKSSCVCLSVCLAIWIWMSLLMHALRVRLQCWLPFPLLFHLNCKNGLKMFFHLNDIQQALGKERGCTRKKRNFFSSCFGLPNTTTIILKFWQWLPL